MQFSGLELSAIIKIAISVAASDGDFAEEEKTAISAEILQFGVKTEQVPALLATSSTMQPKDALSIISLMSSIQKQYVAAFLAVIIAADGKILESEVRVWSLVSALCDLPEMSIADGLKFWASH